MFLFKFCGFLIIFSSDEKASLLLLLLPVQKIITTKNDATLENRFGKNSF